MITCKQRCCRTDSVSDLLKYLRMLWIRRGKEAWHWEPSEGLLSIISDRLALQPDLRSREQVNKLPCVIFLLHLQDSSVREYGRSCFPMMADMVFPFSYFLELGCPSNRSWIHIPCLEAGQTYGSIIAQRRHQKWQSMTSRVIHFCLIDKDTHLWSPESP